jgi:hypothetical protein
VAGRRHHPRKLDDVLRRQQSLQGIDSPGDHQSKDGERIGDLTSHRRLGLLSPGATCWASRTHIRVFRPYL